PSSCPLPPFWRKSLTKRHEKASGSDEEKTPCDAGSVTQVVARLVQRAGEVVACVLDVAPRRLPVVAVEILQFAGTPAAIVATPVQRVDAIVRPERRAHRGFVAEFRAELVDLAVDGVKLRVHARKKLSSVLGGLPVVCHVGLLCPRAFQR